MDKPKKKFRITILVSKEEVYEVEAETSDEAREDVWCYHTDENYVSVGNHINKIIKVEEQ